MCRTSSFFRAGLVVACAAALFVPSLVMAATPAGTQVQATATAQYRNSSGSLMPTAVSNTVTVTVTVAQNASVSISPASQRKLVDADSRAAFGATITNTGSGSDTFDLTATARSGSSATIYRDDNGDGLWQTTETTVIGATDALASGASAKCIVRAQLPTSGSVETDTITLTARSRADATKTAQAAFELYKTAANTSYVTSWLMNAYYPNADPATCLTQDYLGGEASVSPLEGSVTSGITWRKLVSETPYVKLHLAYARPNSCAGYAFAYIYAPSALTANMWLGSDDGIKVWVNGQVVWTNDVYRPFSPDADKFAVNFAQGWNKLLVKISQGFVDWGFSVRICDSSGGAIPGVVYALSPATADDRTAPVISNVTAAPEATSATVEWDTNELAGSLVSYGTTSALGTDYSDASMATQHMAALANLVPETTYYYKVGSADANGNIAWAGGYSFRTTAAPVASPYIRTWLLNGYYPNPTEAIRLSTDYIGSEASLAPVEGMISAGKKWFRDDSPTDYLDMAKAFGRPTYCAGYAACYVYSPVNQTVGMWIGSNDGTKIWLNGSVVWFHDVYRSFVYDKDKTTVSLKTGWNRLLIRLSQGRGSWVLSVKFCDSAGIPTPGLVYATSPGG